MEEQQLSAYLNYFKAEGVTFLSQGPMIITWLDVEEDTIVVLPQAAKCCVLLPSTYNPLGSAQT